MHEIYNPKDLPMEKQVDKYVRFEGFIEVMV